jgi:hypothetical protein
MVAPMKTVVLLLASCAIAAVGANPLTAEPAQDAVCDTPARIEPERPTADMKFSPAPAQSARLRLRDYHPVFQQCRNARDETRLAIRRMSLDGAGLLLTVDPATLATRLEPAQCWTCADSDDAAQKDTRYLRAVEMSAERPGSRGPDAVARNAGLSHGRGEGSFITADLCPSRRPLDRAFLETLAALGPRTPVALSISGLWLVRHDADFAWLRAQTRGGTLDITWVNHSYHHVYRPGLAPADALLMRGFDPQAEILDTERLLIANGETPSVFFRFPGLVSDAPLMAAVRRDHLVALGADGWLVLSPPLRPGAILLLHANGNEPAGLRLFSKLLDQGRLPRPFRPIREAP